MTQPANVRLVMEERLAGELDGKSDVGHGHTISDVSGLSAALGSKADLVGGVVPTSQVPAIALTKPTPVADRAGMLALSAQEGDVAVITAGGDKGSYMLGTGPASMFASWVKLTTPDAPVQSVNGQSGTVTLGAADVGAAPAGHSHARLDAAPATWHWAGTVLPTSAAEVHAQARVGDFIVAPNLVTDPGWHRITGV